MVKAAVSLLTAMGNTIRGFKAGSFSGLPTTIDERGSSIKYASQVRMNEAAMPPMNLCTRVTEVQGRLCRSPHVGEVGYKYLGPELLLAALRRSKCESTSKWTPRPHSLYLRLIIAQRMASKGQKHTQASRTRESFVSGGDA